MGDRVAPAAQVGSSDSSSARIASYPAFDRFDAGLAHLKAIATVRERDAELGAWGRSVCCTAA